MRYITYIISLILSTAILKAENSTRPSSEYVTIDLMGQLGNQLFQIATAYAYALDHDIPLTIPDLQSNPNYNIPYNAKKLFLDRIASYSPTSPPERNWHEPVFNYTKIPSCTKISLMGYFQSEKYFKHRRNEILDLFAAPAEIQKQILAKYPFLSSDNLVVGIQIRDYRWEQPSENYHPTKKRPYYEKAISYFPKDTIFIVSSNNPSLAKECTEGLSSNIIYLEGADYIEEFYTLVLCKSFIIGNSSFGWWASWMSTAKDKIVIAPNLWFSPPFNLNVMRDIFPEGCLILDY